MMDCLECSLNIIDVITISGFIVFMFVFGYIMGRIHKIKKMIVQEKSSLNRQDKRGGK